MMWLARLVRHTTIEDLEIQLESYSAKLKLEKDYWWRLPKLKLRNQQ